MKNFSFSNLFKTCFAALALSFFFTVSASAQTSIDITEKVKSLPKRDGTFLLHNEKGVRLYGIKKDGEIVDQFVIDKKGNPVSFETVDADGNSTVQEVEGSTEPNQVGAKKRFCICFKGICACIWI